MIDLKSKIFDRQYSVNDKTKFNSPPNTMPKFDDIKYANLDAIGEGQPVLDRSTKITWVKIDGDLYPQQGLGGATPSVIKGKKGDTGATGATGAAGANGADGASAYVYVAYASDASGTGFTMTFSSTLNYIAIKTTTSPIVSPSASDFTGLWKYYGGGGGVLTPYADNAAILAVTPANLDLGKVTSSGKYYMGVDGSWLDLTPLTPLVGTIIPSDLANLQYWHAPDSITWSGTTLTSWADKAGTLTLLPQGTVGQTTLNSLNIASIVKGTSVLASSSASFGFTDFTIFLVIDVTSTTDGYYLSKYLSGTNQTIALRVNNSPNAFDNLIKDSSANSIDAAQATNPILSSYHIVVLSFNSTTKILNVSVDGTTNLTANNASWVSTTNWAAATYYVLGGIYSGGYVKQVSMYLAEHIVYSDAKSNADINSIGSYLASKYALSWTNI